jgi:deferrochelatase/peroxidase EfeB
MPASRVGIGQEPGIHKFLDILLRKTENEAMILSDDPFDRRSNPQRLGPLSLRRERHWVGGLASPDLHAIVILFARDEAERVRCVGEHEKLVAECPGVEVLSVLDLNASPPFNYAHDHFGYRDRLSQPVIEGSGEEPTPGSGAPLKAGEFILGYPDEFGVTADRPQPEILARNGSYMAYRRLEEHVGRFRDFLRQNAQTPDEQELLAAKLMGRWRSGAPLVLSPDKDDPVLAADPQRNNDFDYKEMDPQGYAVPLGSHARRMNPRDTAANINRRRMIRRGATYGPALPDGAPDDGVERGIAAFVICGSLIRQFEFAQNVWANDRNFHELGNERDPVIGNQDGTLEFKIPKHPIRKKIVGLPAFTAVKVARTFSSPALKRSNISLRCNRKAELKTRTSKSGGNSHGTFSAFSTDVQPGAHSTQIHAR